MTLAPLATPLDMAKAGIALAAGETDIAVTYLDVASTSVREAAGVPISQVTSTVELEGTRSQWIRPPGVPVTSVSAVSIDDVAVTDYLLRSGQLWRLAGWAGLLASRWSGVVVPSKVDITYTHGLVTVPSDVVNLVCRMAAAALVAWRASSSGSGLASTGNIRQETIGDYSATYGADGLVTEMFLPRSIREQLAARFGQTVALVGSR
jgi:hypothetical protein